MHGSSPPRRARGVGFALAAGLPVLPALTACSDASAAGAAGPWLFGSLALVLSSGTAFALGQAWARRQADAALRAAAQEQHLIASLREDWAWESDAGHRLLRLQPPESAPADEWHRASEGLLVWEHFESAPGDDLRQRLQAGAPLRGLRVRRRGDASPWLLRAAPRHDDRGRFAGYAGFARPLADAEAGLADRASLGALLDGLEAPVVLARAEPGQAAWCVVHANAAARRLCESGETVLPAWPDLLPRLPAPLRNAIAESRPGGSAEHEGWHLRRYALPEGEGLLLARALERENEAAASEGASFSFAVSHDLRAPVRVVEGFTRILKEDYGRHLDRVGNDHLDRVLGAAARMNHMIDAILTLARLSQQPLARQPVNLSQLAAYVVDEMRRNGPERAAEIEIEPGLSVNGDPTLLRLVLENLLGNAWKYTARTKKAHIVFQSEAQQGRRVFVVRDNGAGFDMRSADRLFGLFQRLHSQNDFAGTGVGLASVKRIVVRHGGEIWADSEPGRGAAFYFTLRE